jgi:putative spermidine/putrescine transport system permease protein
VNSPSGSRRFLKQGISGIALRAFAGLMVIWLLAPILVVIPLSFTGKRSFEFPPTTWSTEWYHQLFTAPEWIDSLTHSIEIALLVVVFAGVLGTACAFGLDRGAIPGKGVIRAIVLSPMIIPIVIVAVGVYAVYLPWHLAGHEIGFVLAHTALAIPFVVISVSTSLAGFDRRLEQAAASLGSSPWSTFLRVTLPLIAPGIFAGAVLAFITSFDEVVTALFLATPTVKTLPVQMFQTINNVDPTIAAASTLVLVGTTMIVLMVLFFNRDVRTGR